jgi:spermidine synthase
VIDEKEIDRFLDEAAERSGVDLSALISTDDNIFIEYATPRTNVPGADDIRDTLRYLGSYRTRSTMPAHLKP